MRDYGYFPGLRRCGVCARPSWAAGERGGTRRAGARGTTAVWVDSEALLSRAGPHRDLEHNHSSVREREREGEQGRGREGERGRGTVRE